MRFLIRAAVLAALFHLGLPAMAPAQDVTLTSRDGAFAVSGTLLSFDGEFYRVDTVYGPLTLDSQGVICTGPGCPDMEAYVARFTLSGSPALGAVLMPALIEAHAARRGLQLTRTAAGKGLTLFRLSDREHGHLVAEIGLRLGSTDEGFADLVAEEADIVMAAREPFAQELRRAREAGLGDLSQPERRHVVALDAIVPVVAPGHPVQALEIADMIALLRGDITDWSALNGPEAPVSVHLLGARDGLQQAAARRLLGDTPPAEGARRHPDARTLDRAVARDPLGLGLTRHSATRAARQLPLIGGCGMRLLATRETIKTEDYPFVAPLFLYTPARRLPLFAREFLDYLQSPTAQLVVRRAGFVDLMRDRIPLRQQGDRLAQAISTAGTEVPLSELKRLVRILDGAERLTSTFRFRNGATELDAQSHANVAALARALEAGLFNGRTLIFVGFTDGAGAATVNRRIARDRAEAVRDAVRARATAADPAAVALRVAAFGEALPIACDQSDWGGLINRRVEVWLR
ncbi:phosphate ABC transporter substrate-binding/OmpA family protein [Rhodovulum adriaticum]|uniref:Phosphate ABC transporter substrate-binding protein (PhoT family) n=1 Tax=Rhodovulum adriaticum TaxID=35804 RepID=A0A4R2P129_RHOAD|nr:phosphate ABC transporter substrate-binding/OmpA family protein [Rhodovulum adriaticum]MBK1636847.1 cell envelope biogenesis protein OmpA [Rhodovulum adriaticum]TCP27345.1 phosphate ABC transporter substrate-binding protein (PhoT family) [Rhodovulum adriaticum]